MIALRQIYRCETCGNVLEVMYVSSDSLACCDKPMDLMVENSMDAAHEKHVPVVEGNDFGVFVRVGAVPHPMEEKHYIAFIEVVTKDNMVLRKELRPGNIPEAEFPIALSDVLYAREYCTLHGLWKNA